MHKKNISIIYHAIHMLLSCTSYIVNIYENIVFKALNKSIPSLSDRPNEDMFIHER